MLKECASTCEEIDLGVLAGGARIKRWWHVQGNVVPTVPTGLLGCKLRTAPYRVAVDLAGVPRNYLARLTLGERSLASPGSWCVRELQAICDWLVHSRNEELVKGGELTAGVMPLDEVAPYARLDARALLGKTSLLPGAEFYLLNHPGFSKCHWEGERETLQYCSHISR